MYYVDIKQDELLKLRDGLEILDKLKEPGDEKRSEIFLYGISNDPVVLDAAREAVAEQMDDPAITEDTIQLAEVAVCIPISGDVIYALTGSGMKLEQGDDEFAYRGSGGEGIRVVGFNWARVKPMVTIGDFSKMALASDSVYIDRFLAQRGTNTPAAIQKEVKREEPATAPPAAPAAPVAPGAAPATAPVQKQTSSKKAAVRAGVDAIVENWLG